MSITPESIQELLNSENFGEKVRGINQLRQIEPKIAFEMIKPLVKDSNPRIRYAAVSQFDTLGTDDRQTSLEILRDRLFNDSEFDVQAAAADAIGGLKLTEAFEDLERIYYGTSEWLLQFSILAALGELGEPRGFNLLIEALASDNSLIRTAAISALGDLGDDRAVSHIIPLADDEDWQVRHRVAQSLGRLGGSQSRATLEKLAKDSVESVAQEATNSLNQ
ncbi:HEAT repeat domain-containing protein [Candidatus Gracilibacteria bacterium]|nr:HEAT repeat domain-containing protein [Candidatus Gracilibacteria bacterium]NJM90533.1 HEAT repeat domain-containing protein [Hydrococcus sp. RU_2_2]NJP22358.1 HEAT repeat domain-containing protein [Hydrococcus sp. CRU_1_1]